MEKDAKENDEEEEEEEDGDEILLMYVCYTTHFSSCVCFDPGLFLSFSFFTSFTNCVLRVSSSTESKEGTLEICTQQYYTRYSEQDGPSQKTKGEEEEDVDDDYEEEQDEEKRVELL
jgi:hypothetical protein